MKAIVCKGSGSADMLSLREVEKPVPKQTEVLVKVAASSVIMADVKLRKIPRFILVPIGLIFGFKPMQITGVEFAGIVEEAGTAVSRFSKGDKVFGTTTGLKNGGNAEYVCVPEEPKLGVITGKPKNVSFKDTAVLPVGAMTALFLLDKFKIHAGDMVLINGASGFLGTYAVQIAKYYGAEVTGVCSTSHVEIVSSVGADRVIDYTKSDFTQEDRRYDIVFDAVGKVSKGECKGVLKKHGRFLSVNSPTKESLESIDFLKTLLAEGQIRTVIDSQVSLAEVAEAHRYVEEGHKTGNLSVLVDDESQEKDGE
ncbi:MAG: NAD(P)-dependent alcohol dehydrogenase [Spirochaetia bacterium]